MDMPMGTNNSSSTLMVMTPWLHFGNTDYLIFNAWHPSSHGAIAGACIALFLFCILERGLAAYRRSEELRWRAKTILILNSSNEETPGEGSIPARRRIVPPFTLSHDIPRGVIHAIQATFSYALMLAVMSFNGAYILSIILGLGVGEVLFGRIGRKLQDEALTKIL